LLIIKKNCLQK